MDQAISVAILVAKEPRLTVFGIDLAQQMIALAKQNVPSGHFEVAAGLADVGNGVSQFVVMVEQLRP